jgi:hypothetical protein
MPAIVESPMSVTAGLGRAGAGGVHEAMPTAAMIVAAVMSAAPRLASRTVTS